MDSFLCKVRMCLISLLLVSGCAVNDQRQYSFNGVPISDYSRSAQSRANDMQGGAAGEVGPVGFFGGLALTAFVVAGVIMIYGVPLAIVHHIVD